MKRSPAIVDEDRRVVPRWRPFETTVSLGELDQGLNAKWGYIDDRFFSEKLAAWESERSISSAGELVAAARVLERESEARDAADMLLSPESDATPVLKALAQRVLNGDPEVGVEPPTRPRPDLEVRRLRKRLALEPRNPIAWCDLSRHYAIGGSSERARDAMRVALSQVRGNRFVLRAASRLFVHLGDPEQAQDILRIRQATLHDPWLLSAEIAVATVAGRVSPFIKRARMMLADANYAPKHLAELASALATIELYDGNVRVARRLFRASLKSPTDNSVAQAGWAARRDSGLGVTEDDLTTPRSYEARAWHLFLNDLWLDAFRQCGHWLADEPFSKRPAIVGSHIALVSLADYPSAEALVRRALKANPRDSELLNNLTVALADQGRLAEAEEAFRGVRAEDLDDRWQVAAKATQGLLDFRKGNISSGRLSYSEALEMAERRKIPQITTLALAYFAREEILAGTEVAEQTLRLAERALAREGNQPGLAPFVSRLRDLFNARKGIAGS